VPPTSPRKTGIPLNPPLPDVKMFNPPVSILGPPNALSIGGSIDVVIRFEPSSAGAKAATIEIFPAMR
jgi:hypothetical protein